MSDENEVIDVDDVVIEDAANDDDVTDLDAAEDAVDKAAADVDVSKVKEMTTSVRNELEAINEEMAVGKMENCINGVPLPTFIFQRFINRLDPIEYCQNVLRDHYPEEKRSLHSNQIEFIRAACNPKVRRTAALMARQCLIKGSMIHSREGGVLRIEDHPAAWQTRKNAPVLEIHAHGGHVVVCTENHPVFTPDGWRAAVDLHVGDKIVCMYAWSKWSQRYATVSLDTCELMGMLSVVTHVSMPDKNTLRVVCNSRAVMTRLKKMLASVYSKAITRYQGRSKGVLLITVDDIMAAWLDMFGEPGNVNVNVVGELTRAQTCAYLRGVYNMGASVATLVKKYRTYNADVNLGVNAQHAALVRELLLKLGVRARVKLSCGKWFIVRFKGERNRRMFLDSVGQLIGRKFPKCDDVKEMKLFTGDDGEQLYVSRVTSIKSAGTADVYDVEYPGKGWFIAGGIKVHNSGKCLAPGTEVRMADGSLKKVEDIVVGDQLYPVDRGYAVVKGVRRVAMAKLVNVQPHGPRAEQFTVTQDTRLLLARRKTGKRLEMTMREYVEHEFSLNAVQAYRAPVLEFVDSASELGVEPYFLGLWVGDGHYKSTLVTNVDREVIDYLHAYAQRLGMICVDRRMVNGRHVDHRISSASGNGNKLAAAMKVLGLINAPKHVPRQVVTGSTAVRQQFMAGVIDSDGCKVAANGVEICTVDQQLALQYTFIMRSLGFKTTVGRRIKKCNGKPCTAFTVLAYGDFSVIPTRVPRKQFASKPARNSRVYGFKAADGGWGQAVWINVDENAVVVLSDFSCVVAAGGEVSLPVGSELVLANGELRAVDDLRVGDHLLTVPREPSVVTSLAQGEDEMYRVTPARGGRPFTVNSEHLLSVVDRKRGYLRNVTAEEYVRTYHDGSATGLYGWRAPLQFPASTVTVDVHGVEVEIDPYWVGLWIGAGFSGDARVHVRHQEVIDYLEHLAWRLGLKFSLNTYGNGSTVASACLDLTEGRICGYNPLLNYLKSRGLLNNKHVPREWFVNSLAVRQQLLAGLVDASGSKSAAANKQNVRFFNGRDDRVTSELIDLWQASGFTVNRLTYTAKQCNRVYTYIRYSVHGDFSQLPIRVPERSAIGKPVKHQDRFGFKVEHVGRGEYYGFTLDDRSNKLFLLADGTVTHNTESVASICGYLCDNYPQMRVGVFTPRLQQAETDIGRTSLFYQMNENLLNNQIVSLNKDKVELSNKSYAMAVSASDQSNIEGYTFDVIILDEAQKVSNYTWSERITPMGGACVTGDSMVTLVDGSQVRIDELVHSGKTGYLLPCVDLKARKLELKPVQAVHDVGEREVMKITLSSGRTVEGTYGHPVIVNTRARRTPRWERLENIEVGYRVAVARDLPFFGNVHEQDARLVGMLIGDGSYRQTVSFSNADDALWEYIAINYSRAMPEKYSKMTPTTDGRVMRVGTLRGMQRLTQRLGIAGQVGAAKCLPAVWSTWDAASLRELIAGLWDTDGCVCVNGDRCTLSLCTCSLEIAKDVQTILQKFGVLATITSKKGGTTAMSTGRVIVTKPHYVLVVRNKESIERFVSEFTLLIPAKQARLDRAKKMLADHRYKIPRNLLPTDLRFERVVKVEKTGVKNVYDLTVADHHSFVANGVFVHNTNAKLIKVGTPKTRNHFYDCVEGRASAEWMVFRRDWTQCPQLWALDATMLPDRETGELRPYSTFVLAQMPKALKEWYFPNNPEVWTEGSMDIIDFRTQYMLEFVDGAGTYLSKDQVDSLNKGEFDWLEKGVIGEKYVAGIDFAGSNPDGDNTHITVLRVNPDGSKHKVFAKEFADTPYPQQMYEIARLFGGYTPVFQVSKIFADYTGCGAAVVQTLRDEYGLTMIEGIIFNQTDRYTHSGMNMKNIMYAKFLQALDAGKFAYPTLERFTASELPSAGKMNTGFYHKMIGEWADLEVITGYTVNKKIQAPKGYHDDVCDADVLANFTTVAGAQSKMPRPAFARVRW